MDARRDAMAAVVHEWCLGDVLHDPQVTELITCLTAAARTSPDLDPQTIGGVVGIYIVPEAPGQQPCLALRVLGGQKAYMRLWLRPPPTRVEWGWTLAKGAECLWTDPELDDTASYRPPEGA